MLIFPDKILLSRISAFLSREFHCGKADKRKNSSPLPPPSCVCPLPYLAKLRQQFRSKWVRAKFRIHDHSRQIKLFVGDKEVASGLRPSASPRSALCGEANTTSERYTSELQSQCHSG